ncbi:MAG: 50S ribosomal protein L15 [Limnochordia bacterium]|jgi:large subunit ribosomal protein L15
MRLHEIEPNPRARKSRTRVGRGIGSGYGKTSGRGHKGQGSRSGGTKGAAFEGGQRPLQQRLPKRGFSNYPFRKDFALVDVGQLAELEAGTVVTPEVLVEMQLIKKLKDGVKVLGSGQIDRALTVRAHAFSKSAAEKIAAAGGTTEVV